MKKKLLMVCMAIGLVASTGSSFSAAHNGPKTPAFETVIDDYISSYMNSDFKKLDKVLSDDARIKMPRAEKIIVQYKNDLVSAMKADATKQECTSEYEVVAKSNALILARVDFQYANFKQQNFLTIEKNENNEWKITQVCKFFKNNSEQTSGSSEPVVSVN
ncbi:nuclear transport factor 2 family protein [Mucilaginibacter sp. PPCGB 2223]|uniref:nuclear transport factor 2 family protein n=1 Tax=Mucilaginibacter sp. PPCGB 2223 TaxID=1886027 RepID=UPI00111196C6|nr:nuclear transport factor 2 family protein [Mucilaginibacter sp. PPCGB 2223]